MIPMPPPMLKNLMSYLDFSWRTRGVTFLTALANGMEKKDWSAIYEITRWQAGLA